MENPPRLVAIECGKAGSRGEHLPRGERLRVGGRVGSEARVEVVGGHGRGLMGRGGGMGGGSGVLPGCEGEETGTTIQWGCRWKHPYSAPSDVKGVQVQERGWGG